MMEKMRDDDKDEICARGGERGGGEGRIENKIQIIFHFSHDECVYCFVQKVGFELGKEMQFCIKN